MTSPSDHLIAAKQFWFRK